MLREQRAETASRLHASVLLTKCGCDNALAVRVHVIQNVANVFAGKVCP